jgi:hypothetical protein
VGGLGSADALCDVAGLRTAALCSFSRAVAWRRAATAAAPYGCGTCALRSATGWGSWAG